MRNLFLLIAVSLSTTAFTQVQVGLVREFNSQKKPIDGVQVNFADAVPTTSGDDGYFRLAFTGKKPGDYIFLNAVRKAGYELVNQSDLQHLQLTRNMAMEEDIIMAREGIIDAARMQYHQISATALTARYEKEKKILKDKLAQTLLSQKEWEEQSKELQQQVALQQKNLEEYADRFARMNPDDMGTLQQEALELFKAGDIAGAIKKLEGAGFIGRLKDNLEEKKKIIKGVLFQAELYVLNLQMIEAEGLYDELLGLDSMDLALLQSSAAFYKKQHRYQKALYLYSRITRHAESKVWNRADAYGNMADLFITLGDISKAKNCYTIFSESYQQLLREDSSIAFYKRNVAISQAKLGEVYSLSGELLKAITFYREDERLIRQLNEAFPENSDFRKVLATSQAKLGEVYTALGELPRALGFYIEYERLSQELYKASPENIDYAKIFATSQSKLGDTYTALGELPKAIAYFKEYGLLSRRLSLAYPEEVELKYALAVSCLKLGESYAILQKFSDALIYYKEFQQLCLDLHSSFSGNVNFKYTLAASYSKLGEIYTALKDFHTALECYVACEELSRELLSAFPDNVNFKNGLVISCFKLGQTYHVLADITKVIAYYKECIRLSKELYVGFPDNVNFKMSLSVSYHQLGGVYSSLKENYIALEYLKLSEGLSIELNKSFPENVNFKNELANCYSKIGEVNTIIGETRVAIKYFIDEEKLRVELLSTSPANFDFKYRLSTTYGKLGHMYNLLADWQKALVYFTNYHRFKKELYDQPSKDTNSKKEFATSCWWLGLAHDKRGWADSSLMYCEQATNLFISLFKDYPHEYFYFNSSEECSKQLILLHFQSKNYLTSMHLSLQRIERLKTAKINFPNYADLRNEIASCYGNAAYYALFLNNFTGAEGYAKQGLATNSTQTWIYTNLALAYLYQSKWKNAKAIYVRLKDQPNGKEPFKVAFLQDLKDLEAAGITHPDVAKARALLEEK
jgi:tetratricopeptide (TPR) repeat protein